MPKILMATLLSLTLAGPVFGQSNEADRKAAEAQTKQQHKADKAQAKADKKANKALKSSKVKDAVRAQDQANREQQKTTTPPQ